MARSFKGRVFHGTNKEFDRFEQSRARVANDFYGGGVAYFTDTLPIGKTYAVSMSRRYGGKPVVYEVTLSLSKIFDVDELFTGSELKKLLPKDLESFARGAGLIKLGVNKYRVLGDLDSGLLRLSGAEVFKGLSIGGIKSGEAREQLKKKGYDGLRYNGGANMNTGRHNVYLAYDPKDIKIEGKLVIQ